LEESDGGKEKEVTKEEERYILIEVVQEET